MSKPTAGNLRAAKALFGEGARRMLTCALNEVDLANMLDETNGLPELVEALDLLLAWHDVVQREWPTIPSPFGIEDARTALAKATEKDKTDEPVPAPD